MKTMWILRGCAGSGKSTLATNLSRKLEQCCVLSSDDYFTYDNSYMFDISMLGAAHSWNQWRTRKLCELGRTNIIIDNTNTTFREIKPYVDIAKEFGYKIKIIEPDTPWKFDVE